ncbi:kinase-like domain-containing protein [Pisolithus sp. B1]|nr:kinase-like domain-containing protein [Pisolithus sp. B1]
MLYELSERAFKYSLNLNGKITRTLGRSPSRGGTATVYHGTLIPSGTEVAIKTFRSGLPGDMAVLKRILREVHIRSKLHHENVVPLLGISTDFDLTISIISEWMPLGNAYNYVQNTENDPRPLLQDIISGLHYLHSHPSGPVVHGDLKGSNVLVSNDRRALLTDFGLSILGDSTSTITIEASRGISLRWTAPELLDDFPPSTASDVWAFGMTVLELVTQTVPFSECRNSSAVVSRLLTGKLPPRPDEVSTHFRLTDTWWEICTSCWRYVPSSRPTVEDIREKVKATIVRTRPFPLSCRILTGRLQSQTGPAFSGKNSVSTSPNTRCA